MAQKYYSQTGLSEFFLPGSKFWMSGKIEVINEKNSANCAIRQRNS